MLSKSMPCLLFTFVICSWFQLSVGSGRLRVGLNYAEATPTGKEWYLFRIEFRHPTRNVIRTFETHRDDKIYQGFNEIYFDDYLSKANVVSNPFEAFVSDNTGIIYLDITVFDIYGGTPVKAHAFNLILKTVHGHGEIGIMDKGTNFPNPSSVKFNHIKLGYSFACSRDEFVDQLCNCADQDDSHGHYKCGGNGTKICLPGWTDPSNNCLEPHPCSNTPCKNHGWCTNLAGGNYKCECVYGRWGPTCEESCASQPCQNGGTCEPDGTGYRCDCSMGFSGKNCENQGCHLPSGYPCGEGIKCQQLTTGDFACFCLPGYGGENCDEIDECQSGAPNLCFNGGTCRNTKGGFDCDCANGFTGNRCQERKSHCYETKCKAGEICLDTSSNDPRCVPVDGINCTPGICNNGGTCIEKRYHYVCICLPGFYGETCKQTAEPDVD